MGTKNICPDKFRSLGNRSINVTFCSKMDDINLKPVKNRIDNIRVAYIPLL